MKLWDNFVNNFLPNATSIDERRFSNLNALLYMFSFTGFYQIYKNGSIDESIVSIITVLVTAIAGVNVVGYYTNRTNTYQYNNKINNPL